MVGEEDHWLGLPLTLIHVNWARSGSKPLEGLSTILVLLPLYSALLTPGELSTILGTPF